jgi:hypothetical protein
MPRDLERSSVYQWEQENFSDGEIPHPDFVHNLVYKMCADYCVPVPEIKFIKRPDSIRSFGGPAQIKLSPTAGVQTLIHECCHVIAPYYCYAHGDVEPWHGPTFRRLLLTNLSTYDQWPIKRAVISAREYDLSIARAMSCTVPPGPIRRRTAARFALYLDSVGGINKASFREQISLRCWQEAAEWRTTLPKAL